MIWQSVANQPLAETGALTSVPRLWGAFFQDRQLLQYSQGTIRRPQDSCCRRKGVPIHHPKGVSFRKKRRCPYPRRGCWIHLSSIPSVNGTQGGSRGEPSETLYAHPVAGGLLALRCWGEPPSWAPARAADTSVPTESPRTALACLLSHVILFLDWTHKLFEGWTAARWKEQYLSQAVSMPL